MARQDIIPEARCPECRGAGRFGRLHPVVCVCGGSGLAADGVRKAMRLYLDALEQTRLCRELADETRGALIALISALGTEAEGAAMDKAKAVLARKGAS